MSFDKDQQISGDRFGSPVSWRTPPSELSSDRPWEPDAGSEALTILTTDLPPEVVAAADPDTILGGAATGNGGKVVADSPIMDAAGAFHGREAVVYQAPQGEFVINGLAFITASRRQAPSRRLRARPGDDRRGHRERS